MVNGFIHNVVFDGGCRGNTQGVAALAEGMALEDVPLRLRGINCNGGHSCPDEFAKAVEQYVVENSYTADRQDLQ
ncbi:MAG: TSCPD domain-containing protein [Lachnospiraceae bacterium]|nr:TSCPD domain-containing protein [Lachnospiraceae bacterium]